MIFEEILYMNKNYRKHNINLTSITEFNYFLSHSSNNKGTHKRELKKGVFIEKIIEYDRKNLNIQCSKLKVQKILLKFIPEVVLWYFFEK
jgi:hypothetical protein